MVSFENFVKSMPPSLSEWKVTPSFCFAFKIPDDVAASTKPYVYCITGIIGSLSLIGVKVSFFVQYTKTH